MRKICFVLFLISAIIYIKKVNDKWIVDKIEEDWIA